MNSVGSTRFMRPMDMRVTRRNHRRVQVQRVLLIAANLTLAVVLAVGGYWLYQRTQNDTRFAIEKVETTGAVHTSPAAVERVVSRYRGANLFKLNIEELRSELLTLPWVESVAIEKRIPDGVAVHITERTPVALVNVGGRLRYVDSHGLSFAPLTVNEGNAELPIIPSADPQELGRTVVFLQSVRRDHPDLFARLSEVEPIAPEGFRIVDRDIVTSILVGDKDYADKWRQLYSIVRQESFDSAAVEYADLRFERRIIVKARASAPVVPAAAVATTAATFSVTN
jgi:cell division septal protein FtsQ